MTLSGLSEHSGEVESGYGFIAVAANDETFNAHCAQAVAQGAAAILCDADRSVPAGIKVPVVPVSDLAGRRGALAARFYDNPSAALTCIGVTGTNGKTSVAYHIADLSTRLGVPTGYCGTLGWGRMDALRDSGMTTPNAVALQRIVARMRDDGQRRVALEISSHALAQQRAHDLHLALGVFTNLTRDHLDYHESAEAYGAAKARLFTDFALNAAVINIDDHFGRQLAANVACPVITYGGDGDWSWHAERTAGGSDVVWQSPQGELRARVAVVADFAVANVTAAMAALAALGHDVEELVGAVSGMQPVPGRMELVPSACGQPTVVVDYAHTPDALVKLLGDWMRG